MKDELNLVLRLLLMESVFADVLKDRFVRHSMKKNSTMLVAVFFFPRLNLKRNALDLYSVDIETNVLDGLFAVVDRQVLPFHRSFTVEDFSAHAERIE
jgi:hypothetical protein